MKPSVVGVGHACIDHLGVVAPYPELNAKVELAEFSMQGGGPVATALATLAILGESTAIVTAISDDDFGRFALQSLQSLGVDTSNVEVQKGRLSPMSFIAVDRDSGKRTIFYTRGSIEPLPKDVDLSIVTQAQAVLVDGHQIAAQVAACEKARAANVPVVLDAGSLREGMGELLSLADVLIASEPFATEVAPRAEIEDMLVELAQMGPRVVVVTMGEEGSIGLEGEKVVHIGSLGGDVVDTTGAGDVYHGGFIYGLVRKWPLEKCMQFASAAAGLKCRRLGGRAGIPTLDEVKEAAWGGVEP